MENGKAKPQKVAHSFLSLETEARNTLSFFNFAFQTLKCLLLTEKNLPLHEERRVSLEQILVILMKILVHEPKICNFYVICLTKIIFV